jgi:uncharacterized membrane protein YhaH (DUF805 family)
VKRWWFDGIVWLAVGISLVAQAGFLVSMSWFTTEAPPSDAIPATVASAVVGGCFLVVGFAALGVGVRRMRDANRGRPQVVERASAERG